MQWTDGKAGTSVILNISFLEQNCFCFLFIVDNLLAKLAKVHGFKRYILYTVISLCTLCTHPYHSIIIISIDNFGSICCMSTLVAKIFFYYNTYLFSLNTNVVENTISTSLLIIQQYELQYTKVEKLTMSSSVP